MTAYMAGENDHTATLLDAADRLGWQTLHVRPALRRHGRYTNTVVGGGVGFPALLLVHPLARELWFVEVQPDDAPRPLPPAHAHWREVLTLAGFKHYVWRVPSELEVRLSDLRDVAKVQRP